MNGRTYLNWSLGSKLSVQIAVEQRQEFESIVRHLQVEIAEKTATLERASRDFYEASLRELHLKEIYRLAKQHFPRLSRSNSPHLSQADVAELEKWIGRAKSTESLVGIVDALKELQKYQPFDIKLNLYALVQKIIIEGAYKKKRA